MFNPAEHVELAPEQPKRPHPWTIEQCRQFLAASTNDGLHPLYHLLIVTGMRRGEAVGLTWDNVDLESAEVKIVQQVTAVRGKPTVGTPKTRRSIRVVPIDRRTVELLVAHRSAQHEERAQWGSSFDASGLVFTRADGSVLRPEYVTRHFQQLVQQIGLPVIRLHDLRHTNTSLALDAGVEVKVVSERLGHATTSITNDLYTHVSTAVGRAAADRIADLVEPDTAHPAYASADAAAAQVSERLARSDVRAPTRWGDKHAG